jgi:novobiocin biosynthesis protein NovU/D-mycarose 3-C-methyltransferase
MDVSESARQVGECRVCGETDWQEVVSFGPMPLANGFPEPATSYDDEPYFPLTLVSCRSCRLLSLTVVVDRSVLYRDYAYVTSDSQMIGDHMRYVARMCCERFEIPPGSLVVELGSNIGTQLMAFRDAGMKPLGVDPAENLAEIANTAGIQTLPDFFTGEAARSIRDTYGEARLILGRHVFAHIADLTDIIDGARQLLSPEGVFAIEVPYALDMLEKVEFDTIYHEHLSYFLVGTLRRLFERHGMRVFDVERLNVHGGSIMIFVGLADSPWPTSDRITELLALEETRGLADDAAYRDFAESVTRVRTELPALVRSLKAQGKTIAGYGASAKGNSILNACGLGRDELEFCSDTTDLKQGKVMPGTHIPVCTPQYAKAHAPDYYLLLAWNYADEIIRNERAFLEAGGGFILPIPNPRVVTAGSLALDGRLTKEEG